jgi:hypothetical protein
MTLARCVRGTGVTRDGFHREAAESPPITVRTPHKTVKNRSRSRRP